MQEGTCFLREVRYPFRVICKTDQTLVSALLHKSVQAGLVQHADVYGLA